MKALKFTLLLTVLIATLSSCTKQDLNEDDLLNNQPPVTNIGGDGDIKNR
jgi:hypothetical protein